MQRNPTLEEIRIRSKEIRDGWTEEVREQRRQGPSEVTEWSPPVIDTSHFSSIIDYKTGEYNGDPIGDT